MVRRIALACPRFRGSNWNLMENILLDRPASMRDRIAMYNANALKIGVFGANCSSGRSATKVPERWSASWPDCLRLARMADEAGIDFMLPIARWKGYGGETDFHGSTLETITWAVGLLSATQRMTVFGTVHAPLFHPLIAAKELVTADHVGEGRLGLNLVVGWNEGEFDMFGVTQREHAARYEFAQEWLDAVKRAWSEHGEFDFDGQFLKLKGVRAYPKPYGETRPIIMNAGSSEVGQAFALRNCDAFFVATAGSRTSLEGNAKKVTEIKRAAQNVGREIDVYTVGQVICRPSQTEAEDYYRHAIIENADWGAIDGMLANKSITPQTIPPDEYYKKRQYFASHAIGGYPFVGTPDRVADELESISKAGVRGIALSFVNYLDELPYFCAEVLPRLVRLGARSGVPASHFS
jgi:alkanesulfonate monooxygenase SsuD/methylene tetrahydromethanopterin reductase-like flavin-dependent oxidoreductase (luciferase family)